MSYTFHFGRYRHPAGSAPNSAHGNGFKMMGAAVWGAASAVARGAGQMIRAFDTSRRERRQVRLLKDLSDETLKDIGLRRSEIYHVARKVGENPGVDYRIFCQ